MTRRYLDHNATAPLRPEAAEAAIAALRLDGNSLSVHEEGRRARRIVEAAREALRALVNAPVNGVVFTSGGTEAIHYALHGSIRPHSTNRIFVSAVEHAAVPANAATTGVPVETIPALSTGVVDLGWLKDRLSEYDAAREGAFLVCLMFANNETGVVQPVAEAAAMAHEAGGLLFCDAAQAAGKIPVNFVMSGADMMAVTAHKFGGPVGVGALIAGPNFTLDPVFRGGGHEENRRAGTHNVPAIAGLGAACRLAPESLARASEIAALRDRMEAAVVAEGAQVWGAEQDRLPGTLCLSAPGFSRETQMMALDLAGVAVSGGTACSSGKAKPSATLLAMGASEAQAASAIRVSLGWNSVEEDVDAFVDAWSTAYARVKSRAA